MIALTTEETELLRLVLAQPVVPPSHPSHILLVELTEVMAADPVRLDQRTGQIAAGIIEIVMDDPAFYFLSPPMKETLRQLGERLR